MNASAARKLSPRLKSANMENHRTNKHLEGELKRLELDRRSKLRELNQESNHFLNLKLRAASARSTDFDKRNFSSLHGSDHKNSQRSASSISPSSISPRSPLSSPSRSRSPSPRPVYIRTSISVQDDPIRRSSFAAKSDSSSSPSLSPRSPSPRPQYFRKSLSTEDKPPNLSPESQRHLLSRRHPSPQISGRSVSITETTVTVVSFPADKQRKHSAHSAKQRAEHISRNKDIALETSASLIPQIVIDDMSSKHPPAQKSVSYVKCNDVKGYAKDVLDGSLHVPSRNQRRNSVPAVITPPPYIEMVAKKESTFVTEDSEEDKAFKYKRDRSSSVCVPYFDHLKNTPRRDSLIKKYIVRPGSYRRSSVTLERLISDLAKGVNHDELVNGNFWSKGISDVEWEKLKECRYLRMPSRDEDVTGNTIDIDEIFSQTQNH